MLQQRARAGIDLDALDPMPICGLTYPERFSVWAARVWIECFRDGCPTCPRLENMFGHARLSDHAGPFHEFFTLVAHGARRKLDFHCPGCKHVGADESLLLALLSAQQWGSPATADRILTDWLHPAAARRATYPARLFAHGLADAGLILNCRLEIAPRAETDVLH